MGVVELAEAEVKKNKACIVERIDLEIGLLAGVQTEALDFAWNCATENTVLEKAERIIHWIDGKAKCHDCDLEFRIRKLFDPCPNCNQYLTSLISGKELRVKSLVINQ
jgi:hydrogenase nickel incorporation protein HypA/HybF